MPLSLTPELAKVLLAKKDRKLTRTLAAELLARVEPLPLARYLLTPEVAVDLLAARLESAPDATLRDLATLLGGRAPRAQKTKVKVQPKRAPKPGKRLRLPPAEIEALKTEVLGYLRFHGWATRAQITKATKIPTASIYSRIMGELRTAGSVVAKGEKAGRVYGLKGSGRSKRMVTPKTGTVAAQKPVKRPPKLCPVPGCNAKAAPVFGMMCRDHKDLPKAKRDKLFAARRRADR